MKKIIIYFIIGLMMILSTSALTFNATQKLNATYPFQSNTSDTWKAINSIDEGNVYIVSGCKISSCAAFDGTNDGVNTTQILLPATGDFTIAGWAYTNSTATTQSIVTQYIASTAGRIELQSRYQYTDEPSRLSFEGENLTLADYAVNRWAYFALKRNATAFYLYVDGQLNSTAVNASSILQTQTWFGIASDLARDFKGRLDEWAFWGDDLTDSQITELYNSGSGTSIATIISSGNPTQTAYYFSNSGSDANDCSLASPCQTIVKLNSITLNPGDTVYFARGSVWELYYDAELDVESGTSAGNVTYDAYGTGEPYVLSKLINQSTTGEWGSVGVNIWKSDWSGGTDIGQIYGNQFTIFGRKVDSLAELNTPFEFFYDRTGDDHVYVYSTANPATYASNDIRMAYVPTSEALIYIQDKHDVVFKNGYFMGSGAHGIAGSNTYDINIINSTVKWIGGGWHDGYTSTDRYGNCIQFGNTANNTLVWGVNASECLDACWTIQDFSSTNAGYFNNNKVLYNIFEKCIYPTEYFIDPYEIRGSKVNNTIIQHNTFINRHSDNFEIKGNNRLRFEQTPKGVNTSGFNYSDNVIYGEQGHFSTNKLWQLSDGSPAWDMTLVPFNYNLYINPNISSPFWINGVGYTFAAIQALGLEANGVYHTNYTHDFINFTAGDYRLISTSIGCTMSSTGSYVGALSCDSNQPPTISSVSILNATAYKNTNLVGQCNATDLDGDTIGYSYNWYKNASLLGINSTFLNTGNFSKGDWITFYCNVTDNTNPTVYSNSSVVTILNSPPTTPTISIIGTTITYNSTDVDGDLINYFIYLNESLYLTTTLTDYLFSLSDGSYNSTVASTDGTLNSSMSDYVYFGVNGCGNGVINGVEQCDGADVGGYTCSYFGFNRGILSCTIFCTFDTSTCETVNLYIDSLYNASGAANSDNIAGFISNTNNGVGQVFVSAFVMAFFFIFIMALKRYPIEDVIPSVSFVFFIASIFMRQASLISFYLVELFFFILAASVAYRFIRGE